MAGQPGIERQAALGAGETPEEHQIAHAQKPEELARAEDLEHAQDAARADLSPANMERAKNIGIKDAMGNAQALQGAREHAATAERQHMDRAGADLRPLKCFGGEASSAVREAFQDNHSFATLEQLCRAKQSSQAGPDHNRIEVLSVHENIRQKTARVYRAARVFLEQAGEGCSKIGRASCRERV